MVWMASCRHATPPLTRLVAIRYEAGTEARMIRTLTSACCRCVHLSAWSVTRLLDWVAQSSRFCALIDTGALVTGMTNVAVARYLLRAGLSNMDGCIVFGRGGRKVVVVRNGGRTVPLHRCGLRKDRLFTFYDQVRAHNNCAARWQS